MVGLLLVNPTARTFVAHLSYQNSRETEQEQEQVELLLEMPLQFLACSQLHYL